MRGRPKKENSKNRRFEVRLSGLEEDLLNELHDETGLSKAQIIRKALLHYYNYKLFGIIMHD